MLAHLYAALHPRGDVEFVFLSSDRDEADFDAYRATMPWPAVPFAAAEVRATMFL